MLNMGISIMPARDRLELAGAVKAWADEQRAAALESLGESETPLRPPAKTHGTHRPCKDPECGLCSRVVYDAEFDDGRGER